MLWRNDKRAVPVFYQNGLNRVRKVAYEKEEVFAPTLGQGQARDNDKYTIIHRDDNFAAIAREVVSSLLILVSSITGDN